MTRFALFTRLGYIGVLAAGSVALAGCGDKCADYTCAPCTLTENLSVRIDTDPQRGGFTNAEVAGAYVVRYAQPGFITPLDTVRNGLCDSNLFCVVNLQTLPVPGATGVQPALAYAAFNYRFVLPNAGRNYDLSSIDMASQPPGKGCCSCGSNLRRRAVLNGTPVADDGAGDGRGIYLRR
ncbi:hypothetical protein [Hymenobacter glacialis]|uniref:Lipoprotein n=1 Tax=Hymenobacter glacialis TaxID=1908236 RepID=A0A1G1T1L4_9BACT|nr:hypothetical protein [Hymenobacter glacialis]OGX84716.1 hypothetical protein BEN48_03005 [Hymenobacter glacialis]